MAHWARQDSSLTGYNACMPCSANTSQPTKQAQPRPIQPGDRGHANGQPNGAIQGDQTADAATF
eukprot:CAMPEP_0119111280 /NCGR_PEP_ID=MMETSP1180-20130426/34896_1 /TAXON_ID=3052 ORGANISM="Chlamydomonas cf sp, Strain CCMP681" /NCGR_SAMPLE_ID=MMETSP1180 /ASSEMBLY_ACC=CAM_ASM_000741 /LENGTH=63 /DNA_ID=CAMNT_0007098163 /DNA_START=159 /DNA_END=350 /DNA_ORIENTATION=+